MIQLLINYMLLLFELLLIWFSFTMKESKKPPDQIETVKSCKNASAQTVDSTSIACNKQKTDSNEVIETNTVK